MRSNKQHSTQYQAGFSLVEILVGLVIGLLATLVILQVFTVFEGQKRTTSGAADAQTNGSIALFMIGKDLQMAGFAMVAGIHSPFNCDPATINYGATGITDLSPVTITDGGAAAGASDSITIRYGDSPSGGIPSLLIAPTGGLGANDVSIDNNLGCKVNDIALIVNGTTCNLTSVTGPTDIATPAVLSTPPKTTTVTLQSVAGATPNNYLACLGGWNVTTFQVNPNYVASPTDTEAYMDKNGTPAVADIVNIQAQYGISASYDSNLVVQWIDAVAPWDQATLQLPANIANRNRIKAVRVAVVARSGLLEKEDVSTVCSSLTADIPTGLCAWSATSASPSIVSPAPAIDLSNDPNWMRYRYRVYQTIIPLRNIVWSKNTL
ncbi:MAG: PilW family protein [Gallionella sp.]